MEIPKFPAKIDFNFYMKSSGLRTETSDFGPDFLFSFLTGAQPVEWINRDLYSAGYRSAGQQL